MPLAKICNFNSVRATKQQQKTKRNKVNAVMKQREMMFELKNVDPVYGMFVFLCVYMFCYVSNVKPLTRNLSKRDTDREKERERE